ncbi:hypothetical protein QTO34_013750 [Cnephaeus nilssonii]|uniref:Uncharacterized protein n=1 Tax=Cnephaeus nilssonii TaxID=3371016 RepID=A0AA40LTB8_CNENI|nr:hypothetical protein QTO34_013750 [Eptesicus nilssonii]
MTQTLSSRRHWRRELSVLLAQSATPATLSPAPCASCWPNRGRSGVMCWQQVAVEKLPAPMDPDENRTVVGWDGGAGEQAAPGQGRSNRGPSHPTEYPADGDQWGEWGAGPPPGSQALREDGGTGPCNTQEDTPQRQSPVEAAACRQAAGERPDFSKGFICVFSPLKRPSLGTDGTCNTKDDAPQPKSTEETPSCSQAAREKSTFSEPFVCVFSPSKRPCLDEDAKLNSREGALQCRHKAVALTQRQKARKASSSQSISSKVKGNDAGRCISQDNVPQPESPMEAAACSQAAREKSAISEHLIGVSTPTKRPRLDEDGKEYTEIKEMPISQDSQQMEDSSDYLHTYIPSHALNNNEPFLSPAHGTEVRLMKIYYMRVQLKRGVAVLFHTKEGLVPPSKKIKMEEMTYLGKVHKDVPFSHMSQKKHLIAREPMLDSRAQEKSGEADSPAQPPALGGHPSAKTPEWLVALDSGFRYMACCRVFPTLEVLQEHVECGVREGFSCHVFHRAMAHLKHKERMRKKEEKKRRQRLDSRRKNIMA